MLLPRNATRLVLDALAWSPVVLVEGPRQSGKSVLVRDLVGPERPATYLTLDDALTLAGVHADPQGFVAGLPDPVVLDEIQRAPQLFRALKLSVDEDRRAGRFLLTGSANVLLLPRLSDSLAGRMRIVTLWPFSQGEIDGSPERFINMAFSDDPIAPLETSLARAALVERVVRGGFPQAVLLPDPARASWMGDYVTTLLERDVRDLATIGDRVALPRLLRILAARSGALLNVSDLGRATGIARATLDRYLALFIKTFAIQLVPAWAGDIARRSIKAPKVLFVDSGLAAHLSGLDAGRLQQDADSLGRLLETFVGAELLKQIAVTSEPVELLHYRDSHGTEVDWMLEDRRGRVVAIEVKATSSPGPADLMGLRTVARLLGDRFHRGVLLHTGKTALSMGDRIWALPIDALWRPLSEGPGAQRPG